MIIKILAVHPIVTIVEGEAGQREIPTAWFPVMPKIGQSWQLSLEAVQTPTEQYAQLNQYLRRD